MVPLPLLRLGSCVYVAEQNFKRYPQPFAEAERGEACLVIECSPLPGPRLADPHLNELSPHLDPHPGPAEPLHQHVA